MKRTKIIATLGPATTTKTAISRLAKTGVDAFRINMSHGSRDAWQEWISLVREVAPRAAILMDTKGPEVRLVNLSGEVALREDEEFLFSVSPHETLPYLSQTVEPFVGQTVLLDDGAITTTVTALEDGIVRVRAQNSGLLIEKRKVTLPGAKTTFPVLAEKDIADLRFCGEQGVDAVALSFTRSAADVAEARKHLPKGTFVIAKIENSEGVSAVEEVIDAADGVMIARGDLGVELSLEEVPLVQKRIARLCNRRAKPVIVATQMLETMTNNRRPTRAEASDVANAIIDGADCVMLSGETAVGKYPVDTVEVMARIAARVDPTLRTSLDRVAEETVEIAEAISNAVFDLSGNLGVDAIVSATASGFTARMVARFRPRARIIGVAHDERVMRQLQFSWGVEPCRFPDMDFSEHDTIVHAVRTGTESRLLKMADHVIVTAGVDTMKVGSTNLIEVHVVGELLKYHRRSR